MLAKVPCILEESAFNYVDFIVAGCHGLGTEGIELVIKNLKILKEIDERIGAEPFFQAIFQVDMGLRKENKFWDSLRQVVEHL